MLVTDKEKKIETRNKSKNNFFVKGIKNIPKAFVGVLFIIVGIYACVVSTSASLVPIESMYEEGDKKTTMSNMYLVIQVGAFLANLFKNYIYKVAPQHFKLINTMAKLLFVVSVCSTIAFLTQSQIDSESFDKNMKTIENLYNLIPFIDLVPFYTWIIENSTNVIFIYITCVLLDVIGINLPQVGLDMALGISVKTKVEKGLIGMFLSNMTYKIRNGIRKKYFENNPKEDIKIDVDNFQNPENNNKQIDNKQVKQLPLPETKVDEKTDNSNNKNDNNKDGGDLERVDKQEKKPTRQARENPSKKDYNIPSGNGKNNNKSDIENTVKNYIDKLKSSGETKIKVNKLLQNCNIKKDKWSEIRNKFNEKNIVNYDEKSKITYIT